MLLVVSGDNVLLRDGRIMRVTDAASQDPEMYRWYSEDEVTVKAEMPVETIVVGYAIHPELFEDPNLGEPGYTPQTIVTDMSEVVSILN